MNTAATRPESTETARPIWNLSNHLSSSNVIVIFLSTFAIFVLAGFVSDSIVTNLGLHSLVGLRADHQTILVVVPFIGALISGSVLVVRGGGEVVNRLRNYSS